MISTEDVLRISTEDVLRISFVHRNISWDKVYVWCCSCCGVVGL